VTAWALRHTRGHLLFERNVMVYRRAWMTIFSGFFEPLFYLFSLGLGLGHFVGKVHGVSYASYIAPALLASAAMNGAVYDATTNVFWKLRYGKVYDSMLATPLRPWDVATGEVTWALLRGACYSAMFILVMLVMGLVESWWALLALPASVLIGYAFAGAGMALTTFMRSWQDFEFVQLATMPMFLFSATFYPVETYPGVIRWLVEITPLYQGVALERALTTGTVSWTLLINALYLVAMGTIGMYVASRRLGKLLLK